MKKRCVYLCALLTFTLSLFAQSQTITGTITNSVSKEAIPAVSVVLKGSSSGTFTDNKGNFRLASTQQPPFTLVISSVGYEAQEVAVGSAGESVKVSLVPASVLGTEVVVSASRVPERIIESPVSIERMGSQDVRNAAVPNFYEGLANLKGVDLTTSSLTFKTVSTRGFNGSGNYRFNQYVDGIDNQAPGLNFSVGNIVGPTELDVDNVELLPGASSALYGSGGMNGTLLMTSKNPFKYQGLSVQLKQGIMHINDDQHDPSPYYDFAFRWGKKVNDKFAFKISSQIISAKDWQANDHRNFLRNNVSGNVKGGDRQVDPNYDGINIYGDEASASMPAFSQVVQAQTRAGILTATGGTVDILPLLNSLPALPTQAQLAGFVGNFPAPLRTTVQNVLPFFLASRGSLFTTNLVSRTGYEEKDLVDYDAYNIKVNGGLYYNVTKNIEASLVGYWGTGTTVYTGSDRYALKNLQMGQYKLEFKSKNWFVRAYTVQENSGDSYTATTAAIGVNNAWKTNTTWFQQYTGNYAGARLSGLSDVQANALARQKADEGRFLPGTDAYNNAFKDVISKPINQGGAKFADKTDLYYLEGQLNLTDYVKVAEVLVGANFRQFRLNSNGTIFADTAGTISINEFGSYIQIQRKLLNEKLKLTISGRYDKNENFEGRFTPRATALFTVAKDNNIRLSYQQAYRFPNNQDQYINLQTPGAKLIGSLPVFNTYYHFDTDPVYTAESVNSYRAALAATGTPDRSLLKVSPFPNLKPEIVNSYELGYRGLLTPSFLIDAYVSFNRYQNFLSRVAVARGQLENPLTTTNYSYIVNTPGTVDAVSWGIGFNYRLIKGYTANVNVSSDKLSDVSAGYYTQFNSPNIRYNIGLSNTNVFKNTGFNVNWRWQDKVQWQGSFASGEIPAFGTLDAQVTYRFTKIKSQVKLGASNLLNNYYQSSFGNPKVGGLYYVSLGYNIF